MGDFALSFLIQGGRWSSEDCYIRSGVYINAIDDEELNYGHFDTQMDAGTPEQVFKEAQDFFLNGRIKVH